MTEPLQHVVSDTKGMYRGSEDTGVIHPTWPQDLGTVRAHTVLQMETERTQSQTLNAVPA